MGALPPSPALAIAVHLDACPACRSAVAAREEAEGRLLLTQADVPLEPGALESLLARLPFPENVESARNDIPRSHALALPASLERVRFRPPFRLGLDIWVAHLDAERQEGWRTYLFGGPANATLPSHGHHGEEMIVVLEGRFDDHREFRTGDFVENPPGFAHGMQVSPDGRLVALVAAAGPIAWRDEDRKLAEIFDI